jgi:hypothetical protein
MKPEQCSSRSASIKSYTCRRPNRRGVGVGIRYEGFRFIVSISPTDPESQDPDGRGSSWWRHGLTSEQTSVEGIQPSIRRVPVTNLRRVRNRRAAPSASGHFQHVHYRTSGAYLCTPSVILLLLLFLKRNDCAVVERRK